MVGSKMDAGPRPAQNRRSGRPSLAIARSRAGLSAIAIGKGGCDNSRLEMSMTRCSGNATTVFILAMLAGACGGGNNEQAAPPPDAPTTSPVDAATAGNVTGRVTFAGTAPKPAAVRMESDP